MTTWKYTDATKRVVSRTFDNGSMESCMVEAIAEWLSEGNTPEAADVSPEPTYKELRATEYNLKSTGEQLGMQYDDAKNSTTTWVDWQTEIKVRIPK
jgi:hypothetical protein